MVVGFAMLGVVVVPREDIALVGEEGEEGLRTQGEMEALQMRREVLDLRLINGVVKVSRIMTRTKVGGRHRQTGVRLQLQAHLQGRL